MAPISVLPKTKIVFLTAHENNERLVDAIRAGAKGYFLKITPAKALLSALYGIERGDAAIKRVFTLRLMDEFSKVPHRKEINSEMRSTMTPRECEVLEELR